MTLTVLSWIAIGLLCISYWFQIWKIHVHREVRDISLAYNVLLAIGFGILGITALKEGSTIFLVKQIVTTIPVIIIIIQVLYHRGDRWHNTIAKKCNRCSKEVEKGWDFCVYCGEATEKKEKT